MIFSLEQAALVMQGKIRAALTPRWQRVSADRVRVLRREFAVRDGEGNPTGERLRDVARQRALSGEMLLVVFTVISVEPVDIFATEGEGVLTAKLASACGYKTVAGLREAWRSAHPRSPVAAAVWFELGDVRDRARFLTSTRSMRWAPRGTMRVRTRPWPKGSTVLLGDYTASPALAGDRLEALSAAELARYGTDAHQRHAATRLDQQRRLQARSAADRLSALKRLPPGRD